MLEKEVCKNKLPAQPDPSKKGLVFLVHMWSFTTMFSALEKNTVRKATDQVILPKIVDALI